MDLIRNSNSGPTEIPGSSLPSHHILRLILIVCSLHKIRIRGLQLNNKMNDIEQDLEEFANYILTELKQSNGEVSNWDEVLRKWKLIEKKKDLEARKKLK
ncbi:MAG TPA: hypothetical protein VJS91_05315 [Nitrososphaeraceae archaeon]|nr:hypothetical protein [Nitrososphaeraceae archaeon]